VDEDLFIPCFEVRWCTRAVLEGLQSHYQPRCIHIMAPRATVDALERLLDRHGLGGICLHREEEAFEAAYGLDKDALCQSLNLGGSLYNPGWFYQQILKLGAPESIEELSRNYLVWDSDLLPVATWPVRDGADPVWPYRFALLQDKSRGNPQIVAAWEKWIRTVLAVEPVEDPTGTFVPHHLWMDAVVLKEIQEQISSYYQSEKPWPLLMMQSASEFGTFSEFWLYSSWLRHHHPERLIYHPYEQYGATTERFFEDGSGPFATALGAFLGVERPEPGYSEIMAFIRQAYEPELLPSSLSFESSPRHLKKKDETRHTEELRSRWRSP